MSCAAICRSSGRGHRFPMRWQSTRLGIDAACACVPASPAAEHTSPVLPLVSIAVTTWNSSSTLERCLESVLSHNYDPLELIVVDNASSDFTRNILERFNSRCTVILNDTNTGFAAAQNQ